MSTYSVSMTDSHGLTCYLSIHGRTSWKTKRTAKKHADDIRDRIMRRVFPPVTVKVENEFREEV